MCELKYMVLWLDLQMDVRIGMLALIDAYNEV